MVLLLSYQKSEPHRKGSNLKRVLLIPILFFTFISCSKKYTNDTNPVELSTKVDSISYGMGVNLGSSYKRQDFDIDPDLFFDGFVASYDDKECLLTENDTRQMLRDYYMEVRMNKSEKQKNLSEQNKVKSDQFLKKNKTSWGVV